jgi:hypothetical protein
MLCSDHFAQCVSHIGYALLPVPLGTRCLIGPSLGDQGSLVYRDDPRCSGGSSSPVPSASTWPSGLPSSSPDIPYPCSHASDGVYCGADAVEAAFRSLASPSPPPCYEHFYQCYAGVRFPFQAVAPGTLCYNGALHRREWWVARHLPIV